MSDSKFSVNQIDVDGLSNDPTMQANLAGASTEYVDAKTVITWEVASQIGNSFTIVAAGAPAVAALNGTDVAFIDSTNDDLSTYRFDGTDWVQVGNGLNIVGINTGPALTALNGTDVAFIDSTNDDLSTYRFDGTDWSLVGNKLIISLSLNPAITALNGTDIAFIDSSNDELRTYRFSGSPGTWAQVGNGLSIAAVGTPALTTLNGTDIAFIDGTNDELRTYRFDDTDWTQVGNGLAIATVGTPAITALNGTDIAFIDGTNDELRTYRFDATAWARVGGALAVASTVPAITALNGTDIVFFDPTSDELITYKFGGTIGYPDMASIMDTRYIGAGISAVPALIPEGWVLTGGSFDNVSFDFTNEIITADANDITFSDDGTHMFIIDNDDIYHYTLSSAWDITSATFSESKIAIAEDSAFGDLVFKPDGLKMYLVGGNDLTIYQYSLSPAWDVSTISYDSVSFVVSTSDGRGMFFRSDGLRCFVVDYNTEIIHQLELDTAWDVSTMRSPGFRGDITADYTDITSLSFSEDGRRAIFVSDFSDNLISYNLTTPWEIATLVDNAVTLDISAQCSVPSGLYFKTDGGKVYVVDRTDTGKVFQYSVAGETVYETTSTTVTGISQAGTQEEVTDGLSDRHITAETLNAWGAATTDMPIGQWSVPGWSMDNAYYEFTINFRYPGPSPSLSSLDANAFCMSDDGLNVYITAGANANPDLFQWVLNVAWDITTVVSRKSYHLAAITHPTGIYVQPGGDKMWALEQGSDQVHEYDLATPYDVSTATASSIYTGTGWLNPEDLFFRLDGTTFWIVEGDVIREFTCDTPWSVAAVTDPGRSFSVVSQETQVHDVSFSTDGTRMLITGAGSKSILPYDLSAPFDVTTAVYDNTSYDMTGDGITSPQSMWVKDDGTKIWIANLSGNILQIDIRGTTFIDITLDEISDVAMGSPLLTNEVLTYDGTNWTNAAASGGSVALNDITDVTLGSPVTDQALTYDGTNWVNLTPPYVNIDGDKMTGTLFIGDGTSGRSLVIQQAGTGSPAIAGGHPNIKFRDVESIFTTTLIDEIDINEFVITKIDPATSNPLTTMTFHTDGNVSLEGGSNVPNDIDHLTRKDYVDTLHANRNVIINGNLDIWQRGTSFAAPAPGDYSADRFKYSKDGTMVHTITQSSATVPTYAESGTKSNYSLHLDVTTAQASLGTGNYNLIGYIIEGYDYARIAGGDATLSFWVRGSKTGIHCVSFRNSGADRSYVKEYTINTADTWQKVVITIPLTETGGTWDYITGGGLEITFALAVGTTYQTTKDAWQTGNYLGTSAQVNEVDNVANNFRIAQVQFERGSVATPLEYKSYADEVTKCQRYFQRISSFHIQVGVALSYVSTVLSPRMRGNPDVAFDGGTLSAADLNTASETRILWRPSGTAVEWSNLSIDAEL